MRAMILLENASLKDNPSPLIMAEVPRPEPGEYELLIEISTCGVCHTELDEIEGRAQPSILPIIPGHQVVGTVVALGARVTRHGVGERVGVGWIHSSSGGLDENLSPDFRATGRDHNGGYAEYIVVGERYAYKIPDIFDDITAAPLLCAGGVGFRSFRLTGLQNGQALGLTGFGGSGHIVMQIARYLVPDSPVYVFARSEQERQAARVLGARWTGHTEESPPELLDAIIDTTPAWRPVLAAMERLRPGGRLVINAIRKEDTDRHVLAELSYSQHLWMEKEIKSVANVTADDIEEFLEVAALIPIRPRVKVYSLSEANEALRDLAHGSQALARVLNIKQ